MPKKPSEKATGSADGDAPKTASDTGVTHGTSPPDHKKKADEDDPEARKAEIDDLKRV